MYESWRCRRLKLALGLLNPRIAQVEQFGLLITLLCPRLASLDELLALSLIIGIQKRRASSW